MRRSIRAARAYRSATILPSKRGTMISRCFRSNKWTPAAARPVVQSVRVMSAEFLCFCTRAPPAAAAFSWGQGCVLRSFVRVLCCCPAARRG
eukprot:4205651-Lingulodinium_polyedra.AAC.1